MNDDPLTVHLRWMIRRDMPEVVRIETLSFEGGWTEEDFLRALRQKTCIGYVAEKCDDTLGGFFVYELQKGRLELLDFAVHPDYRRRAVGTQMLDKLKRMIALSYPRRDRIVAAVREYNLPFQLFLRANRFEAVGVKRKFYDDTEESAFLFEWCYEDTVGRQLTEEDELLEEEKEE